MDIDPVTEDRYGRTVAVVWEDKLNANEQMIRAGYAWVYKRYCQRAFCFDWVDLEEAAKNQKIGLWQEPDPIPPWEWRRRK